MYVKPLIVMGLVATLGLTGCSYFHPYRPDIKQGNVMSQDRVAQLKVGMSRQKVTEIMGTPVLNSTLPTNQVQYIYTYSPNSGAYQYWRVTLTFQNGLVTHIDQQQYTGQVRHAI